MVQKDEETQRRKIDDVSQKTCKNKGSINQKKRLLNRSQTGRIANKNQYLCTL